VAANARAVEAATWVLNMENGPERSMLYNGHMSRRREIMQGAYRATDYTEADAWLIEQWERATSADDDDPCCEECVAWYAGEMTDVT